MKKTREQSMYRKGNENMQLKRKKEGGRKVGSMRSVYTWYIYEEEEKVNGEY